MRSEEIDRALLLDKMLRINDKEEIKGIKKQMGKI